MSKYNYAPGAIHIDNHKDLNIDVKSVDDAVRLMSAFMSDRNVEDVPSSSVKPESDSGSSATDPDNRQEKNWRDILGVPKPNKYSEVRRHILERLRFDDEFREFYADATRVELCQRLSNEFGWDLDPNSLGKNMNRKH